MRDEDEGDADVALQLPEFNLHLLAQLLVEGPQWLIQQENLRTAYECPGQRHTLALAAGQLVSGPRPVPPQFHEFEGGGRA